MIVCDQTGFFASAMCEMKTRLIDFGIAVGVAAVLCIILFIVMWFQERNRGK